MITINEEFNRVSTFWLNKKTTTFELKKSEFKLKVKGKSVAVVPVDLSKHIGNVNPPTSLTFGKTGVILRVLIEIVPACRVKHAHLFKDLGDGEEEENEDESPNKFGSEVQSFVSNEDLSTRATSTGQVVELQAKI